MNSIQWEESGLVQNNRGITQITVALKRMTLILVMGLVSALSFAQDQSTTAGATEKVNLNQADAQTLQYIPGVGASKAASIIQLREQKGGFKKIEELLEVKGIGEKLLQDIQQFGVLEGGVSTLTESMRNNPPKKSATRASASESPANSG